MATPDKLVYETFKVPSVADSEKKIEEDAPAAISYLDRNNITDLYEALGLSNYVKDGRNG